MTSPINIELKSANGQIFNTRDLKCAVQRLREEMELKTNIKRQQENQSCLTASKYLKKKK